MLRVDTSLWVEHFQHGVAALAARLAAGEILLHPFVIGELACGHWVRRASVLDWLQEQPQAPLADHIPKSPHGIRRAVLLSYPPPAYSGPDFLDSSGIVNQAAAAAT